MEQEQLYSLQDSMENASSDKRMSKIKELFPSFKIHASKIGISSKGANKYRVTIINKELKFSTTFTDSIYNTCNRTPSHKIEMLYCILMDAQCYENYNSLEEFADNFGLDLYEERSKAKKCFEGCRKAYESIIELFSYEGYEILDAILYGV